MADVHGYSEIYEDYRGRIREGELAVGERLPSVRKEASARNASAVTVHKAYTRLQDEGYIVSNGRYGSVVTNHWHALQISEKVSSQRGDSTLDVHPLNIQLFVEWEEKNLAAVNPFLASIERTLTNSVYIDGGTVNRYAIDGNKPLNLPFALDTAAKRVCIFLVENPRRFKRHIEMLSDEGAVCIALCSSAAWKSELACDVICVDDQWAFRSLGKKLFNLGHRKIGFLGHKAVNPTVAWVQSRQDGLAEGLASTSLALDESDRFYVPKKHASMKNIISKILKKTVPVYSVIVCANDELALQLKGELEESGVKVPEDISLIGYDNIPHASAQADLMTFSTPDEKIVSTMLSLVQRRLQDHCDGLGDRISMMLNPIPIPRGSCKPITR